MATNSPEDLYYTIGGGERPPDPSPRRVEGVHFYQATFGSPVILEAEEEQTPPDETETTDQLQSGTAFLLSLFK